MKPTPVVCHNTFGARKLESAEDARTYESRLSITRKNGENTANSHRVAPKPHQDRPLCKSNWNYLSWGSQVLDSSSFEKIEWPEVVIKDHAIRFFRERACDNGQTIPAAAIAFIERKRSISAQNGELRSHIGGDCGHLAEGGVYSNSYYLPTNGRKLV